MLNHHKRKLSERAAAVIAENRRFPLFSLATPLHVGSLLYGTAVEIRSLLYQHGILAVGRVSRPVLSVGNLTVGGTGKTPMTVHLAKLLHSWGLKAMIVSRGYKSAGEREGIVVCDGRKMLCDAHAAGDEPCLMARLLSGVPVMVGQNRFENARKGIRRFSPDVILLDDAFQHQALARDLNLVLMDARHPIGNGYLLPRGPLREPISALDRADAILFTRGRPSYDNLDSELKRIISRKPYFQCHHLTVIRGFVPAGEAIDPLDDSGLRECDQGIIQGRPVFTFSGLANNKAFCSSVDELGADVKGSAYFSDHHRYSREDIDTLIGSAIEAGCRAMVTSDKDFMRLSGTGPLPMDLVVLGIEIDFRNDTDRWQRFLRDRLMQCGVPTASENQME